MRVPSNRTASRVRTGAQNRGGCNSVLPEMKNCLVQVLTGKDESRTAAVQDASRDLAPCKFRQVLDCGCPSAAFGAADLVTDTFNRTPSEARGFLDS